MKLSFTGRIHNKYFYWIFILSFISCFGESTAQSKDILSLDELAGTWQEAALVRSLPAVNSTQGSAQAVRDILAVGKLSFPPITMRGTTGSLFIDGKKPELEQTRWYPYQVLRKGKAENLYIETAVRMIYNHDGLLFHIVVANNGNAEQTFQLKINLTAYTSRHIHWGWKIPRDADTSLFKAKELDKNKSLFLENVKQQLGNCFSFEQRPDELVVNRNSGDAIWNITLHPRASRVFNYVLTFGEKRNEVHSLASSYAAHFESSFKNVKSDWLARWAAMFTKGNPYFSGYLPILKTSDQKMKRIYYMSLVSILSVYRTCFPVAKRVYVSNTPESNCTMMYFWDTREWATVLALLDPVMMKQYLTSWLSKGIYKGYAEEFLTGTLQGVWYSANDYSIFILLNDYLTVTGDKQFLSEKINGKTVLQHIDSIATHWKSLVRPGQTLADYGEAQNLLECVPTYINEVASFNAANVWMMNRTADIWESKGNKSRAEELRTEAKQLLKAVLKLYIPEQGVWYAKHDDGTEIQVRHVFDFATIGLTIYDYLTDKMKNDMTDFVEQELLTDHWMRAQSLSDPAANVSDRPDHGPMGAYCAWPAETIAAMCQFNKFSDALNFLNRCDSTTYEGPFSQSRELMGKTPDAPVRIAERGSGGLPSQTYNASNGGGFAESIIREFFGYQPDLMTNSLLHDEKTFRGFYGELIDVRKDGHLYDIKSARNGLSLIRIN